MKKCIGLYWVVVGCLFFALTHAAQEKVDLARKVHKCSFPSSYPLVSGSVFRDICHHKLDEKKVLPEEVEEGDLIFVRGENAKEFLTETIYQIQHKFILISHLTPWECPGEYEKALDVPNLVAWFGKNANGNHPKLHQLPIGLYQAWVVINSYSWNAFEGFRNYLQKRFFGEKKRSKDEPTRPYLLSKTFTTRYNTEDRNPLIDYVSGLPFCASFSFLPYSEYCEVLRKSSFVLSPPGKGMDCHRTWEAMLSGAYPVILSSFLDPLYKTLPVVIVKDWREVTESFLLNKQNELSVKVIPLEQFYADYWIQHIMNVRDAEIPMARKHFMSAPRNRYITLEALPPRTTVSSLSLKQAKQWAKKKQCIHVVTADASLALPLARALPSYGRVIVRNTMAAEEARQFLSNVLYAHLAQKIILLDENEWNEKFSSPGLESVTLEGILADL